MKKSPAWLVACLLLLTGCSTATIRHDGSGSIPVEPTYQQSQHFLMWGLVGEPVINADELCNEGQAWQVKTQTSFTDGVISSVTFGIYQPRTAKIWCGEEPADHS